MPEIADTKSTSIPQRSDMAEQDKWDLTILFKDDSDWEENYEKTENLIDKASQFVGKLAGSPEILYKCLESRTEISKVSFNLFQYAKLNQDIDNRVSKYQAMTDKAAMLMSKADATFSFIEP